MPRRKPEPPLDPFERAARRVDPQFAQLAETAVPPRSLRAPRLLLMFAVVVVGVAVIGRGSHPAELKRSCTTPAFAIGTTTVDVDAPLRWSVAGPATDHVVLTLDEDATPVDGPQPLTGCLARGAFRVQAHTGQHTVTATVVTADGRTTASIRQSFTVR